MKLNTDSMAQGTSGRVVAGGIFRDHMRIVIGAYCFDAETGKDFLAKISALIQGIEYAYHHGWRRF